MPAERFRMDHGFRFLLAVGMGASVATSLVDVTQAGELDDLTCSSPIIVKIVRKIAKQDFRKNVGGPNKLYDVVKAIRTQVPGVCIATYDYGYGLPRGYFARSSNGSLRDWYGDKIELVYDFQVTDDKTDVIVHVNGFNWNKAPYGLLRPEQER